MITKPSNEVLYGKKGKNDECYTPNYAVLPLLKYIGFLEEGTIWCPFDTKDSEFVKVFESVGFNVIASHIDNGQDFYTYLPDERVDCIISNPPFTNKRKIFERALSLNIPFALLMSNTWLNDSAPMKVFKDKDLELLMFDKRIEFINPQGENMGRPTFSSSYFCYDFLPKQIIMEKL